MLPVTARAEVAEGALPGGKAVLAFQCAGEFLLRFAKGQMTEQGARELTNIMQGQIESKTWEQHWPEPEGTTQHSKAS